MQEVVTISEKVVTMLCNNRLVTLNCQKKKLKILNGYYIDKNDPYVQ